MPLKYVTLKEALDKGYEIIEPEPIRRTAPPTTWETAEMIGWEVVPALIGGAALGIFGGGAGAALGNYWSQSYRQSIGLSDEFSGKEFVTATAAGLVPLGRFAKMGMAAKIPLRATEGMGIALAEAQVRIGWETGEWLTQEEAQTTALFGGIFGGSLGAVEAKFFRHMDGGDHKPGDKRPPTVKEAQKQRDKFDSDEAFKKAYPEFNNLEGPITGESIVKHVTAKAVHGADEVLNPIAEKVKRGEPLDAKEQAIHDGLSEAPSKATDSHGLDSKDKRALGENRAEYESLQEKMEGLQSDYNKAGAAKGDVELPKELRGAKPMFGKRRPVFESDIDRALWIVRNRKNKSKSDHKYMAWLQKHYPHAVDDTIRGWGDEVHAKTALFAKEGGDVEFVVPKSEHASKFEASVRDKKQSLLEKDMEKVEARLEELSAKARKPPPEMDEAAKKEAPEWTELEGNQHQHKDGWVIKELEHEGGRKEFELLRKLEDRLESKGMHPTLAKAKTAQKNQVQAELEKVARNEQADATGFPWFDAPVVKHKKAYLPIREDGSPDTTKNPISKLRIGKHTVLATYTNFGEFGVLWHRYGDISATDMLSPPKIHARTAQGLSSKLRKMERNESLFNQGFSALFLAGVGLDWLTRKEESAIQKASPGGWALFLALVAGLAGIRAARFRKTQMGKHLHDNPKSRLEVEENRPRNTNEKGEPLGDDRPDELLADAADPSKMFDSKGEPYKSESWWSKRSKGLTEKAAAVLSPMSRLLKNMGADGLVGVFRKFEKDVRQQVKYFLGKMDFVTAMEVVIKRGGVVDDWYNFKIALRNKSYKAGPDPEAPPVPTPKAKEAEEMLQTLMDKYNNQVIAYVRKQNKGKPKGEQKTELGARALYEEFNLAMEEMRLYAFDRGDIRLEPLENYFPSGIKDWPRFREYMRKHRGWDELESEIDEAIREATRRNKEGLTLPEEARIVSDVLKRDPGRGMSTTTSNLKKRIVDMVDRDMIDAYIDPAAIVNSYVRRMVNAAETRNFLGVKGTPEGINPHLTLKPLEGGEAAIGHYATRQAVVSLTDLGLRTDMEGAIAWRVAQLAREKGVSRENVAMLQKVIQARFNAKGHGQLFHDAKNLTYLAVLGNFGSAVTQLGDLAYSFHFNGMGNTFKAMYNQMTGKGRDLFSHMGLENVDIDLVSSRDGLSKVLNFVLKHTQFQRLDKFGKNTVMESAFFRFRKMAQKEPQKLIDELTSVHGKENAMKMRDDLLAGDFSPHVEQAIWSKFLDLQPAAQIEMPMAHATAGASHAGSIVGAGYWLKSFTLKQFDVFREAGVKKIEDSRVKWHEGDHKEAMRLAKEGLAGTVALAAWFAAMNGGTSMIKDAMYGRKTNPDELSEDLVWRLIGVNRYHSWKMRREGTAKAVIELLVPPTTAFDRVHKDLWALTQGEAPKEVYRGIAVGDFYYWHHGGGREKTRRDLAKRLGVKLSNIPE